MSASLDRHQQRFAEDPGDVRAFEAVEEAAFLAGEWDQLVGVLERRLATPEIAADPRARARLLCRLGQVEQRRGDREAALGRWHAAVHADPTCQSALSELRDDALANDRWDVALQIAESELALDMAPKERARLHGLVGTLWLEQLDDAELAHEHFARAMDALPEDAGALEGAARTSERLGRPAEAAVLWGRLAVVARGPARAQALVAQARLGRPDAAGDLYRAALTEEPDNLDALDGLAALAERDARWPLAGELHERRHAAAPDAAGRAAAAEAAGRILLEEQGDAAAARGWLQRAVDDDPTRSGAWRRLADAARELGDDAMLRRALDEFSKRQEGAATLPLLLELASLESADDDETAAAAHLRQALALAPDDVLVIEALSDTLARLGEWQELADWLERRAALASGEPATRAATYVELAAIHEQQLGNDDEARRSYERALQAEPSDASAIAALERIHRKAEDWSALRGLLEHAGRAASVARRPAHLSALGRLLADPLDDAEGAAAAFDAALALDPTCDEAHRSRQQLAERRGDPDALLAACEREADVTTDRSRLHHLVRELVRMYRARGRDDAALRWIERWIETTPEDVEALRLACELHRALGNDAPRVAALERLDPLLSGADRAALRRELGAHHSDAGRRRRAVEAYRGALEADPGDRAAHETLADLLDPVGQAEELAGVLRGLVDLTHGADSAGWLDLLGQVLAEPLGDVAGALDVLRELSDMPDAPADVHARIESLLERGARHEELAEHLARRSETADPATRRELRLQRARVLLEHLSRFADAAAEYRALANADPDDEPAHQGLERALRAAADPRALADFLEERARRDADPAARDACALERATLLEEVLGAPDEAVAVLRTVFEGAASPANQRTAAERLARILERGDDPAALRDHLEAWLARDDDPATARKLHDRLGRLYRHRLADSRAAAAHLEAALEAEPGSVENWATLTRIYEEDDRPAELGRALEGQLDAEPDMDAPRERALRLRAANLWAARLADPDRARSHYARVLEIDPGDGTAGEFLIDHYEGHERHDQVARVLERRLTALDDQPRDEEGHWERQRTSLRLRIAGLRGGRLDDAEGAIAVLEPGIGEIGLDAAIIEPLADLYQRAGYSNDLVELCERAAGELPAGPERATWLTRLGDALRGLDRRADSATAYERALVERPNDVAIEAALRDLYRALENPEPLARLLEARIPRLGGPAEVPTRLELAGLYEKALARPADALREHRRILQLEPSHAESLGAALRLAEQLDESASTRELIDAALSHGTPASVRADLLARRAGLLAAGDSGSEAALADYREALRIEPQSAETRAAYCETLIQMGEWEAALECLHEEALRAAPELRAEIVSRAANLAWDNLSGDAALVWLERLRQQHPDDPEVMARLAETHRLAGRAEAQLRALQAELALRDEPERRVELLTDCSRILEHDLDARPRAIHVLEQARELAPDDPKVLRELDRLYAACGRHRDRAEVLETRARLVLHADRIAMLREAASLYAGPLGEPDGAARLLFQAVSQAGDDAAQQRALLRELGDALREAGPPEAWALCAETELAALDPADEVVAERRLRLRRELAAHHQRAGCLDATIEHLRELVDTAPHDFDPDAVLEAWLIEALQRQGNLVEYEWRTTARLERTGGDVEAWLAIAQLRDERLSATGRAAEAYRRALALSDDPTRALRGLRSAAERLGRWDEVSSTLEQELARSEALAPAARAELYRRLGDVCWERLGSTTGASRAYAAAIETWPQDFAAQRSLQQLLEAMEDWRGALDLYESEIDVLGDTDPERRQAAWLRAGELARDHTGESERARRAYLAAAKLGALRSARVRELAELHAACDDGDAFIETFARWCDDPDSGAEAADHVRLAEALQARGDCEQAVARTERALEAGAGNAHTWTLAARLREQLGEREAAAEAWEQAAGSTRDARAADAWRQAAALRIEAEPEAAAALLRKATAADPGSAPALAALADAALRTSAWEEAETTAQRALDLSSLEGTARHDVAITGARAARERGRTPEAAALYTTALEVAPQSEAALAGAGECLAAIGEWTQARERLEARLAHGAERREAAALRAVLGRCLAEVGETDAALAACETAIEDDPRCEAAHALCVELHEQADRIEDGVAALQRWALAIGGTAAGQQLLRAAQWELRAGGHEQAAERHLREATEASPRLTEAWRTLAGLLCDAGEHTAALDAAAAGLGAAESDDERAALEFTRGRALEGREAREEAAAAYGEAARLDPRCKEAVESQARLLRESGHWGEAAEALARFADAHPGDDRPTLAEILQQRGRLLAGPLEDLDGAVAAYRRAVELHPERSDLGNTLANLLSHRPDAWREAMDRCAETLTATPADPTALRAMQRIAGNVDKPAAVSSGIALLHAVGIASPDEVAKLPNRIDLRLAGDGRLACPTGEALRDAVRCAAEEIGAALGAPSEISGPAASPDPVTRFRAAALAAEAGVAAPGLLPLPLEELTDVVRTTALLSLAPDSVRGSGAILNALSEALGRRTRRRVRRALADLTPEQIEAYDYASWRVELRALAAAKTVDTGVVDLRTALIAHICDAEDREASEFGETADITPSVAACDEARATLRRAVQAWIAQITA